MSRRVQVTLSEDEWAVLRDLAEARGESMSRVLGREITAFEMVKLWRSELKHRAAVLRKLETIQAELARLDAKADERS